MSRETLRRLTVFGPAIYLTLLAAGVLYYRPQPLPPLLPAFVLLLVLSAAGTLAFSRFVFAHVQRQEAEIERRSQEVAEMNEAMAVVRERQRIARELHDSLAQKLGYLHLRLADVERRSAAAGVEFEADVVELKAVAREAYEDARQGIFGLRRMVSRSLGFVPTLAEYLHDWSRQTRVAVDLTVAPEEPVDFGPAVEVQLVGIIQEALANVRKHARAHRVAVSVERAGRLATVVIRDDGVGFDPRAADDAGPTSFGLETMRERAEAIGARLVVRSRSGEGTSVSVWLPLGERRQEPS
ncbi:MAG: sensor histidine kinase [Candidatus Rokubacteria bacterium]|nr:sensor histidine kinase [Candidatus Rokubacteria bacterium]